MKASKAIGLVEPELPGEEVVAAGKFAPTGSLAAQFLGGEVGRAINRRVQEKKNEVVMSRVMFLAVTKENVHLLEAKSGMGWKVGNRLASWRRDEVIASKSSGLRTLKLTLRVPPGDEEVNLLANRGDDSAKDVISALSASPH